MTSTTESQPPSSNPPAPRVVRRPRDRSAGAARETTRGLGNPHGGGLRSRLLRVRQHDPCGGGVGARARRGHIGPRRHGVIIARLRDRGHGVARGAPLRRASEACDSAILTARHRVAGLAALRGSRSGFVDRISGIPFLGDAA
jgi:hypothetical protein